MPITNPSSASALTLSQQTANSAYTLSVDASPGQNLRLGFTSSDSIFTFGEFTVQQNYTPANLPPPDETPKFGNFATLNSMGAVNYAPKITYYVSPEELNLPSKDPGSYTYFSSFYTEVANSINDIIQNFPYAILADDSSQNIYNYSQSFNNTTGQATSQFNIPVSCLINQGGVIYNSANTVGYSSLTMNYDLYSIQLSGNSNVYNILNYQFVSTGGTQYLYFQIDGLLFNTTSATTFNAPVYIRPSVVTLSNYKNNISPLEEQLLYSGVISVPDVSLDNGTSKNMTFTWPLTIDGFNPDNSGIEFQSYQKSILQAAASIDEVKTNIFVKSIVPENFLEFDSTNGIYNTIVQTYAHEFDELKRYIDGIAYAHSVEYNGQETTPSKFMFKLSNLLGWKLSENFNEANLLDYLTSDGLSNTNTYSYFNVEIWKRIMVNLVWLYKKKGTRDALTFIFKLLGAPDCLICFDEFIYRIQKTSTNIVNNFNPVNSYGYIDYTTSIYDFQQGGTGRGDGQEYINQWRPYFNPDKQIDNVKTYVGEPGGIGTQCMINTKELNMGLDPAKAVECDVFQFYQLPCACWNGNGPCVFSGSGIGYGIINETFVIGGDSTPSPYQIPDCMLVNPTFISGMTLSQYLDFIYTSNIDPTNRKTNSQDQTTWWYPELKRIFLNYYFSINPSGHCLTVPKLEYFLSLIEVQIYDYTLQLLPATTILNSQGTIYRNPMYLRQRFVYRNGINAGSEFSIPVSPNFNTTIIPIKLNVDCILPNIINLSPVIVSSNIGLPITSNISQINVGASVNNNSFSNVVSGFNINSSISVSHFPFIHISAIKL